MKKHSLLPLGLIPLCVTSALGLTSTVAVGAEEEAEKVIVTGSRIRQSEGVTNAPIMTMTREEIDQTGLTSIADILQNMSTSGSALNTRFNSSGNFGMPSNGGGVGAGGAEVDMRHLGSNRVLILVDGKRWVSGSSASGVSNSVDLNTIPLALVEKIEVLEDGASTIYGSDAIAGVVNIITKKDIDGWQLNASYGGFGSNPFNMKDGETSSFDLTFGTATDKMNMTMSLSHVDQNVVYSKNRSMATHPLMGTGNTRGSSATPYGRFLFYDANGDFVNTTPNGNAGFLSFPDDFHDFTNDDRFNYAAYNLYVTPNERTNIYTRTQFEIDQSTTFTVQAMYNKRKSKNQAAPEPIFIGPEAGAGAIANSVVIHENNPYNPFGLTLDADNFIFAGRRPVENGPRQYFQDVNTSFISAELTGELDWNDSTYYWDVSYGWGKNDASQIKTGGLNAARIKKALGDVNVCNADPNCVPLNIWGAGAITSDMLDYISYTQKDASQNKMQTFAANITGDLFEMPAGYASFAAGYEHRKQSGFFEPDPIAASGESMGIPAQPTQGGYDADEFYFEGKLPLVADAGFADALDFTVAFRSSDYDTSSGESFDATTSKFGLLWRVNEQFTARATWSEGFRAPSIGELFQGPARNDATLTDPCLETSNHARCQSLWGMDFTNYQQFNSQISVQTGGYDKLTPEKSETLVWGVVYSPDWFDDSETLDSINFDLTFYEHEIDDAIQALDAQTQLDQCVASTSAAEADFYCSGITRVGTGSISGFSNSLRNIGGVDTSGADLKISLYSKQTDMGRFGLVWRNTFVNDYIVTDDLGGNSGDIDGIEFGSNPDRAIPEWKYDMTLNWSKDDWSASTTIRYMSKIQEKCSDYLDGTPNSLAALGLCSNPNMTNNAASTNTLDETYYVDFSVSYDSKLMDNNVRYTLGARNLLDQDPPLCTQCDLNSYLPGLYDPQGQQWFFMISLRPE